MATPQAAIIKAAPSAKPAKAKPEKKVAPSKPKKATPAREKRVYKESGYNFEGVSTKKADATFDRAAVSLIATTLEKFMILFSIVFLMQFDNIVGREEGGRKEGRASSSCCC